MSQLIESKQESFFENIYDKHSALLYGIILKISKNNKEAEEILIQSFKTFFSENAKPENNDHDFLYLLRITISIVSEKNDLPKGNIGKLILDDLKSNTSMQRLELSCLPAKLLHHTLQISAGAGKL